MTVTSHYTDLTAHEWIDACHLKNTILRESLCSSPSYLLRRGPAQRRRGRHRKAKDLLEMELRARRPAFHYAGNKGVEELAPEVPSTPLVSAMPLGSVCNGTFSNSK